MMFVGRKREGCVLAWEVVIFSSALTPVPGLRQIPALLPHPCAQPPLLPCSQVGFLVLQLLACAFSGCARSCPWAALTKAWACKICLFNFLYGFSLLSFVHSRSTRAISAMAEMHRECVASALASGAALPWRLTQVYPVPWVLPNHAVGAGEPGGSLLFLGTTPELQSTPRMLGCAGSAARGRGR